MQSTIIPFHPVNAPCVQVRLTNVYGAEKIYPANETAELFARMVNQKTLTRENIGIIKALGYRVDVLQDKITL